ncbi:MAG: hypothetical protein P1V20_21930 [Verrucomicrobiales bacterium]|nr:hypothetical protein [Verrucomicrobiales bacterium]
MVKSFGRYFFVVAVVGNLFLNHLALGFCHCEDTVFVSHCPCEDSSCDHHCPVSEEDDCSSYLYLDLDTLSQSPALQLDFIPVEHPLTYLEPSFLNTAPAPVRKTDWLQAKGPPGQPVAPRILYSVYLI